MLTDGTVTLRAMETADLSAMYVWENDTSLWSLGDNTTPFSCETLRAFIESATENIYITRQLRLIIEVEGAAIGTADLFDFNPLHLRAAIGILVYDPVHRGRGYATRATRLLCRYAFEVLHLRQLYVHVPISNVASIAMCRRAGFTESGVLRQWCGEQDAMIMQLFNNIKNR